MANQEPCIRTETKDFYPTPHSDFLKMVFNDNANVCGFDFEVVGIGKASLKMTQYFMKAIEEVGISTHMEYVDLDNNYMIVKKAIIFGKNGLNCSCSLYAGSLVERFGEYVKKGRKLLFPVFEMRLKDGEGSEFPINREQLEALGILLSRNEEEESISEYDELRELTLEVAEIVKRILAKKGITLLDIELEFGAIENEDDTFEYILIGDISPKSIRCSKKGKILGPVELAALFLNEK